MKLFFLFNCCITYFLILFCTTAEANYLPQGFVYLKDIDPTIKQDIRYTTDHNFIGRPIKGYEAAQCILTRETALALSNVQKELLPSGLSLKVYDCYRPQMAVNDFITWSEQPEDQKMKKEFYPRVDKADFFTLGYVAKKSGHSRGSTVDLTLVPLTATSPMSYHPGQSLLSCVAPYNQRFYDGSIDMGTNFDCMDNFSHNDNTQISIVGFYNRMLLKTIMVKHGFTPLTEEWWHFTLTNEPYPNTYFDFPIK